MVPVGVNTVIPTICRAGTLPPCVCVLVGTKNIFETHLKGRARTGMEWHDASSDGSYSSDDDLSVWSSDDEDANRPATGAELRRAMFSEASLPDDAPRNDMFLRKQQTAYTNRHVTETTPVLPQTIGDSRYARLDDGFVGMPSHEDREVTGVLVDVDGKPYAKIMESKPPPPNTNRKGLSHQHNLRRALGYDPHVVHRKSEAAAVLNGADLVNGDADLTDARRQTKATLLQRGDAFHNKSHTHKFSEVDAGRGLYDGYNTAGVARDFEKRRHHVEHTWRNTVRQEHDPKRAATQSPTAPVHGHASTQRRETAQPFRRESYATYSTLQLDSTVDIPIITHTSRREGDAPLGRANESRVTAARTSSGDVDVPDGEREMHNESARSTRHVFVSARRAEAAAVQREGADDEAQTRNETATALSGMGQSQHANVGDHVLPNDVVGARKESMTGHVAAPMQHAVHTVDGTDASAVTADSGVHNGLGHRVGAAHDASDPKRASTDGRYDAPRRAGGSAIVAPASVDIGDDRPPVVSSAMWYFSVGKGEGAERHRPSHAPTKALAGSCFINDRLAQPYTSDWRSYNKRVEPKSCDDDARNHERLTPVPHDRGGEPPSKQLAAVLRTSAVPMMPPSAGRSTPLHRSSHPTPMALR